MMEPIHLANSPNPKLDFSIKFGEKFIPGLIFEPKHELFRHKFLPSVNKMSYAPFSRADSFKSL